MENECSLRALSPKLKIQSSKSEIRKKPEIRTLKQVFRPFVRVRVNPNSEVASVEVGARCRSADILVRGFTGLSSPVFPIWNWRLAAERRPAGRQNPQAGKPALPPYHAPTSEFNVNSRSNPLIRISGIRPADFRLRLVQGGSLSRNDAVQPQMDTD
jgi:hypothetical protein